MSKEPTPDSIHQMLPLLLKRNSFHIMMLNLQSLRTIREMTPGLVTKLIKSTKPNGKLIFKLLELTILILLKIL